MARPAEELFGRHLFVYGSLVQPRRLREVLGHPPSEVLRARLHGYRRELSPAYEYPFVVEEPDASVDGLLVLDLTGSDLECLDTYEDVAEGVYCRVPVEVEVWGCSAPSATLRAETYIAGPALRAGVPLTH